MHENTKFDPFYSVKIVPKVELDRTGWMQSIGNMPLWHRLSYFWLKTKYGLQVWDIMQPLLWLFLPIIANIIAKSMWLSSKGFDVRSIKSLQWWQMSFMIYSHPFHSMSSGPPSPEIQLFKSWPWNFKVKIMGVNQYHSKVIKTLMLLMSEVFAVVVVDADTDTAETNQKHDVTQTKMT